MKGKSAIMACSPLMMSERRAASSSSLRAAAAAAAACGAAEFRGGALTTRTHQCLSTAAQRAGQPFGLAQAREAAHGGISACPAEVRFHAACRPPLLTRGPGQCQGRPLQRQQRRQQNAGAHGALNSLPRRRFPRVLRWGSGQGTRVPLGSCARARRVSERGVQGEGGVLRCFCAGPRGGRAPRAARLVTSALRTPSLPTGAAPPERVTISRVEGAGRGARVQTATPHTPPAARHVGPPLLLSSPFWGSL